MALKLFKVKRSFTSYGNIYVKAEDAETARDIANNVDGGEFISEDELMSGHSEIESVEETTDEVTDDKIYTEATF